MALTFFSRCESDTLDGTHDYSAGDTTWTLSSLVEFSTSGVKIGTNGLYTPGGDDYGVLAATSILAPAAGTVAFWLRFDTYGAGSVLIEMAGTGGSDYIRLGTNYANGFEFRHRSSVGNNQAISTSSITLTGSTWYFVQMHWSAALDSLHLSIHDSSGSLIEDVENTSAGLGAAMADMVEIRMGTQFGGARVSIDNVFFGSAYADDFLSNRDITSYTGYGGGGASAPKRSLLLGIG